MAIGSDLDIIKDDLKNVSTELKELDDNSKKISGIDIGSFFFQKVLTKMSPIDYCEKVLRAHLPDKYRSLHENQTALINVVTNKKIRKVAGLMSRQCIAEGSIIHTRSGNLVKIENHPNAWKTNDNAPLLHLKADGGFSVICTYNHPIMTEDGWKEASKILVGEKVVVLKKWDKNNDVPVNIYKTSLVRGNIELEREKLNKTGIYAEIICVNGVYQLKVLNNPPVLKTECYGEDGEELSLSTVTLIETAGSGAVWDVEYPNKGWFICGGIQVHNSGKCFAKDTEILMSNGDIKNVQDIQIGEKVMSPESKPVLVTALGNGQEEMFEICPKDEFNNSFTVNKSHILSLKNKNNEVINITVDEYLKNKKRYRNCKGYRAPVDYPYQKTNLDPYEYGLIEQEKILNEYLINSYNVRYNVLAGILDQYYYLKIKKHNISFMVFKKEYALDIVRLSRSLGFKANYKNKKVKLYGNIYKIPTKKHKIDYHLLKKDPLKFNFDVKPKGEGEYFGFTIDSQDHLFLLADYTVTHNTESIASFVGYLLDNYPNMRIGIFTPRIQQAEIDVGRTAIFFQMNEDKLNNKLVKCTKQKIELSNGSFVQAISGSDQSNIEGLTFDIIVLDEAQKISDYTWSERIKSIVPLSGNIYRITS